MNSLSITELHTLRLAIFDNAENLHKEAKLLHEHKMFSRAYLLAHFCFEELGKIPIIVGAIGKLTTGESVDWRKLKKRFYSHTEKISSQNQHYYTFGLDLDLLEDTDLKWLNTAQQKVDKSFNLKNLATYVDVSGKSFLLPGEQISESASKELLDLAFECLRAHWHSENLTNPVLKKLTNKSINRTS
ncbi:abortive infection protein, AbiV family [Azotobacter beijerinckii]|uniref:Abortive infection protein, AbiV family n=1 Tax=Azotobacter beijerinckii TaxID=170623 RepID=A0A1H6YTK7_9GAMM|nr:AbiV family abortive infection protein [Azotobacter beijerinckii]SEJ44611.1 abortive infection protein, AbiV family [Azotobacter beijerinckii]